MIWESEDQWDHPLLRYATVRDYAHCTLRFRWRSHEVKPLDAIDGPTLTIEGRDAAGVARNWYVRLWNYATGTPENAVITLPFDALRGGFLLPDEADPVWPGAIDRLFISIVPKAYDKGDDRLPGRCRGVGRADRDAANSYRSTQWRKPRNNRTVHGIVLGAIP